MKNILILNDGDIYGFIFSLYFLKNIKDIKLIFLELKQNSNIKTVNYFTNATVNHFNKYNINIIEFDFLKQINGIFNYNKKFINFFDLEDIVYFTHEKELNNNDLSSFLCLDDEYSKKIILNLYSSFRNSENSYFTMNYESLVGINFDDNILKNKIINECALHNNFELVRGDLDYLKDLSVDYYIDNSYNNLLSDNSVYTDCDIIPNFNLTQNTKKHQNKDIDINSCIFYDSKEFSIIESIPTYEDTIVNTYEFGNGSYNKINKIFYKDKVFNIGTSYLKFDFSFGYDQLLILYTIDKVIEIIKHNDFRESKLIDLENNFLYLYKNILNFIGHFFLYSKRTDSLFWNKFNTKNYYDDLKKYEKYNKHLFSDNKLLNYIKSRYFNNESFFINKNHSHILYDLLVKQEDKYQKNDRFELNLYRFLKKYVYKEKEEANFLR